MCILEFIKIRLNKRVSTKVSTNANFFITKLAHNEEK